MTKLLLFLTIGAVASLIHEADANCRVSVNGDLGDPQPLILNPNGNSAFHLPSDDSGNINFAANAIVEFNCPGSQVLLKKQSLGASSVRAFCAHDKLFTLENETAQNNFNAFTCQKEPFHIARYTGKTCLGNKKEIQIGFQINKERFLTLINICFDDKAQNSLYSAYNLTGAINGYQANYPRPEFIEDDFYNVGNNKVNALYVRNVQRININRQLGLTNKDYKYIQKSSYYYLARGHLTAKADFVFGAQHSATFHYVNVAPQWQTFNGDNWNELEKSVRYFAGDNRRNLMVYTGTHGITTLPHDRTGDDIELYLYDNNGKNGIPVPQVYWKVVYDDVTKAGVAFVGVNNPYHSVQEIEKYRICKDVCNQIKWKISWKPTNLESGYSYCCNVDDFRQVVKSLPEFTVKQLLSH